MFAIRKKIEIIERIILIALSKSPQKDGLIIQSFFEYYR